MKVTSEISLGGISDTFGGDIRYKSTLQRHINAGDFRS